VTYREAIDTANREYLTRVLAEARGKVEAAAMTGRGSQGDDVQADS
jgi:hypothetical protein